jgi:hypothetical protein
MTKINADGRLPSLTRVRAIDLGVLRRSQSSGAGQADAAGSKPVSAWDMQSYIDGQIGAVNFNDPSERKKIFKIFLSATLLREFGPALANDPKFSSVVDSVDDAMSGDDELRVALTKLVDQLVMQHKKNRL